MPKFLFFSLLLVRFALVGVVAVPLIGHSAPNSFGIRHDGKIDQATIAKAYKESDWDQVTHTLESYLRRQGDSRVSIEERIFAYKYLGVIYAADSLSRSKAESYFTRLLNLSPKVEILDLFASKRVNEVFEEMKREHERRSQYSQNYDTYGRETTAPNPPQDSMVTLAPQKLAPQGLPAKHVRQESVKDENNQWVWWSVGIAVAASIGAGAYYLTSQEPSTQVEKAPAVDLNK